MQNTELPIQKKRRWWVASLLNFLTLIGGYVYLGRLKRAALVPLFLLLVLCLIWVGPSKFVASPKIFLALSVSLILMVIFILIDPILLAIRSRNYRLKPYNKWWVYMLCIVPVIAISMISSSMNGHANVRGFYAPSSSMFPTIAVDDFFTVDMTAYNGALPSRGDVVVFEHPRTGVEFVKRIIALPNERVSLLNGKASINGEFAVWETGEEGELISKHGRVFKGEFIQSNLLGVQFQVFDQDGSFPRGNYTETLVPDNHYFVLGDNRDNSVDSRSEIHSGGVGFVPIENIKGKAIGIYFSDDFAKIFTPLTPSTAN